MPESLHLTTNFSQCDIKSISGRLRSASDLEDTGVISRDQKAILKDLIIAGDSSVQGAIDKYESGDPSALEQMIKSGALLARSSDVDLLGDLDLDFLNVHEDDGMMFGNMDDIGEAGKQLAAMKRGDSHHGSGASDGIGDLEFNGDLSNPQIEPRTLEQMRRKPRGDSIDDIDVHRMRANSLALPGMLLDHANPADAQISFGRWMDNDVGGPSLPPGLQTHARASDVLMASKFRGSTTAVATAAAAGAAAQDKKPKAKLGRPRKGTSPKKERKEPRERKSQAKIRDIEMKAAGIQQQAVGDGDEEDKEVVSGLGRPRSMSDPNLSVRLDNLGLLHVEGPKGWVGAYSPDSRQMRVNRFLEKRQRRVWTKKVKYDVRKNFADSRLRVKGRFVKKEDEMLMRELMSLT